MSIPQEIIIKALAPFAPHFCRERTWEKAKVLVIGTLLTNGRRVVTAALRTMGLQDEKSFNQYHHVLSRAKWSGLAMARTLLMLLVKCFFRSDEPLVFGIDETIERRWGGKIKARGIYRDAVRSSASHFVKTGGLTLDQCHAVAPYRMGKSHMGLACVNGAGPFQTFFQEPGSSAQNDA